MGRFTTSGGFYTELLEKDSDQCKATTDEVNFKNSVKMVNELLDNAEQKVKALNG